MNPQTLTDRAQWWHSPATRDFMALLQAKRDSLLRDLEAADPRDPIPIAQRQAQIRLIDSIQEGREAFLSFCPNQPSTL